MSRVKGRAPITKQRSEWEEIDLVLDVGVPASCFRRRVGDGVLRAIRAEEPAGLHLSVSFASHSERAAVRYPTWDEIADARDALLPSDREFSMIFPKLGEYVALHDSTFHLHENPELRPLRVETYRTVPQNAPVTGEPEYRWRVVHASNGETMASGEGYTAQVDRDHAVEVLFPGVEIVEVES